MKKVGLFLAISFFSLAPCFAAPSLRDTNLKVNEVVSGLNSPTTMAFIAPDDILILQKNDGKVRRVLGGVLQPGAVLDVAVDPSAERGLLGITLHPDFPETPFVYLYYTESSTGSDGSGSAVANRVYRYTWNGSQLTGPTLILDLPVSTGPNHNGGIIIFGPDGKLYVVIGDLNRNGQLQNFASGPAADDTSVILRLNEDGSVPGDNPFAAQGSALAKYYAYGIRNSFGMTFDPLTEMLWMTENGPDAFDEINLVEPGFNSGWEQIMGPDARDPQGTGSLFVAPGSHYSDPEFSWQNPVGPTALVFLHSTALGVQYQNDLFVGDINNGTLYRFQPNTMRDGLVFDSPGVLADLVADNDDELDEAVFGTGFGGITDLKVGPDGLLYVVSFGDGKIYVVSADSLPPLSIRASLLPEAEVGVAYTGVLEMSGGSPPYAVTVVRSSLPAGLNIEAEEITGTPTRPGKAAFTVQVTDQAGASVQQKFRIRVANALLISAVELKPGTVGRRYRSRVKAKGGKKPYSWSLLSGSLPAGLSIDSTTGLISGTPTVPGSANLTFEVTDPLGGSDQKTLTLVIN